MRLLLLSHFLRNQRFYFSKLDNVPGQSAHQVTSGYAKDMLMLIQRRYFKRYPLDLPHEDEPSAEHLAAINDNEPDPEPDQIRRWLAYQHMKDQDLDPKESGAHNPYRALLAKLTKKDGNHPRCKLHTNVWQKTQCEAIEEELKKRMGDLTGKKTKLAAECDKIAREMFQALDNKEKGYWGRMATEEHEVALKAWKKETEYAPSDDPVERQRCIQGLVCFAQPILDMICEVTSWKASLIARGPEPAHGGHLNIISRRLPCLPDAEGFMPMKSLDEDNDNVTNFDTYDPSTEPATQSVSSSRPSPLPAQNTAANRPSRPVLPPVLLSRIVHLPSPQLVHASLVRLLEIGLLVSLRLVKLLPLCWALPTAPPAVVPAETNLTSAPIDAPTVQSAVSAPSILNSPDNDEMSNPFLHDIQPVPSPVPSPINLPAASPAPSVLDGPVAKPPTSVDHSAATTPSVVKGVRAGSAGKKTGSKRRQTLSIAGAGEGPPAKRLQTWKGGAAERASLSKGASAPSPAAAKLPPPAKRRQSRKATTAVPAPLPSTTELLLPVEAPSDLPKWFKNTFSMFESATLDSDWTKLLQAWANFECDEDYKEYTRLGASHHPLAVAEWIAFMAALFYWGIAAQKIGKGKAEWNSAVKDCTTALSHLCCK
ncbi:hypothetical protein GALMADRAFT_214374 [Galerina marginata CBS 339.88]|uniref:Uncharacterized protein n=1 Tax=Galerina marginata (strain CBS 339.88) TaxID=685588 RepID=A0A067SV08_GALM3|nr:hypothetical protein GALMADRAFT_214374 [Galerina marginata CBS 339.88]